jgi:hypothetical protein
MSVSVALLGDSIFDNGAYVGPHELDVGAHLALRLEAQGDHHVMHAVDGAMVRDVAAQLHGLDLAKVSALVVSVGGNDALAHVDLLTSPRQTTTGGALAELARRVAPFRSEYSILLDRLVGTGRPLIVCTIYNPCFDESELQEAAVAGLSLFNDVILTEAVSRHLPVIDLRRVCDSPVCFANPIEPSHEGGKRIANAICAKLQETVTP